MTASKLVLNAASGVGGAGEDVDALYGIRVWEGTSDTRTITTDSDLSGEGGMVWIKKTSGTDNHQLFDTVRGATKVLVSNDTDAEATSSNGLTAFGSSGFNLGSDGGVNSNNSSYVSWSFRKAKKFFDIVTYSGNSTAGRTVSHNLGSVPGCIFVKSLTDGSEDWCVYHRGVASDAETDSLFLNGTDAALDNDSFWNDTAPTSTVFTLGTSTKTNNSGHNYVAYLFAHNDGDGGFGPDGDADIIKCGNYTGNSSSGSEPTINLGFEPQWIMFKNTTTSSNWFVYDVVRGWRQHITNTKDFSLAPDSNVGENAASGGAEAGHPTATGFDLRGCGLTAVNTTGDNHIFVAIRRGPLNVPEDATKVFGLDTDATGGSSVVNFRPHLCDMAWFTKRDGSAQNVQVADRVRGFQKTNTNTDNAYTSPTISTNNNDDEKVSSRAIHQTDTFQGTFPVVRAVSNGGNFMLHSWRRAPSYFDIVAYEGNGSAGRTVTHNLGAIPEMIWVKRRDSASQWGVYHKSIGSSKYLHVDNSDSANSGTFVWNGTDPTSTVFTVGDHDINNNSNGDYVAYLFATADGVSKVGSVSHTFGGGDTNVDCGFTSGARFIILKSTTHSYSWEMYDSVRGIVSGNDPYIRLDTTDAEVTNNDGIDPLNSGFTLTSTGYNTGTYMFYAIA